MSPHYAFYRSFGPGPDVITVPYRCKDYAQAVMWYAKWPEHIRESITCVYHHDGTGEVVHFDIDCKQEVIDNA